MTSPTREAGARAVCEALGDDWFREGPDGLLGAYGAAFDAVATLFQPLVEENRKLRAALERITRLKNSVGLGPARAIAEAALQPQDHGGGR